MAETIGVNPGRLEQARVILLEQSDQATGDIERIQLSEAAAVVGRILKRVAILEYPEGPHRLGRIQVPKQVLREMLADGMDVWVADLLGWGRPRVRRARRSLQVEPCARGGSTIERTLDRRRWEQTWIPRLREMGITACYAEAVTSEGGGAAS